MDADPRCRRGAIRVSRCSGWFGPRARVAAAGYVAVAILGIAAGVARALGLSGGWAAGVGAIAAAPLVIALVGERVTGIKGFGIAISLQKVTVDIGGDDSAESPGFASIAMHHSASASGVEDLAGPFRSLIAQQSEVLRINLRDDDYWWPSRIFLVAALAQDFTAVKALVFVRSGDQQVFVGIAAPQAVRAGLAHVFPIYEVAYRQARTVSGSYFQDVISEPFTDMQQILEFRWRSAFDELQQPENERNLKVGNADIRDWLQGDLDTKSFADGPLTTLRQYRILTHDRPYAALTSDHGRLESVVGRDELANRLATKYLERRLGES